MPCIGLVSEPLRSRMRPAHSICTESRISQPRPSGGRQAVNDAGIPGVLFEETKASSPLEIQAVTPSRGSAGEPCGFTRLLKKTQVSARQGKIRRKSAVYRAIHEHFEPDFNAVSCHMSLFQQPVTASPTSAGVPPSRPLRSPTWIMVNGWLPGGYFPGPIRQTVILVTQVSGIKPIFYSGNGWQQFPPSPPSPKMLSSLYPKRFPGLSRSARVFLHRFHLSFFRLNGHRGEKSGLPPGEARRYEQPFDEIWHHREARLSLQRPVLCTTTVRIIAPGGKTCPVPLWSIPPMWADHGYTGHCKASLPSRATRRSFPPTSAYGAPALRHDKPWSPEFR